MERIWWRRWIGTRLENMADIVLWVTRWERVG